MALTAEELNEMAVLAAEVGDEQAELEALEQLESIGGFGSETTVQSEPLGVLDTAIGAANIANRAITGLSEQAVAGIGGALESLNPFASEGAGARQVEAIQQAIPDVEIGAQGQQLISDISERFQASPQMVKDIASAFINLGPSLSESTFQTTGSPLAATIAGALPEALEAATGLGGARAAQRGIVQVVDTAAEAPRQVAEVFARQSPAKQKIAELIASGSTDIDIARFKLVDDTPGDQVSFTGEFERPRLERLVDDPTVPGGSRVDIAPLPQAAPRAPRVESDVPAIEAIKQGFDEGVIADVKQASKADKSAMRKMVNIAERSKKNKKFGLLNRPGDVAGDTLMGRLRVVQKANRDAGKSLNVAAEALAGKSVEAAPIGDKFASDLSDMGVSLQRNNGGIDVDFAGSDIEGLAGPESVIERVVKRMSSTTPPDAKELHRLKRFIDEQVTFGKNAEGLAGNAERVLKGLRRDINETLGAKFPDYAAANKQYSKTIGALDAFQDVAGRKMNLTGPNADRATGVLMRRLMSNAQSRVTLLDSINEIDAVAKEFGGRLTGQKLIPGKVDKDAINDLFSQVLFADELDSVFGPAARTSLQGQFDQALKQGVRAATTQAGAVDAGLGVVGQVIEKARGINEAGAFKSIKDLLKDTKK